VIDAAADSAAPAESIGADASLRDALARMFTLGVDALAVTGAGGERLGTLTLAGIRARTRSREPDAAAGAEH
jgi:CBS domain-containing protein